MTAKVWRVIYVFAMASVGLAIAVVTRDLGQAMMLLLLILNPMIVGLPRVHAVRGGQFRGDVDVRWSSAYQSSPPGGTLTVN